MLASYPESLSGSGLEIWIGGVDRGALYAKGSLTIEASARSTGSARFRLWDTTQSVRVRPGYEIWIYLDGEKIFGGAVQSVEETTPGSHTDRVNEIDVEAVDWNHLPDRYLVADQYENLTQGEIVKEIVTETGLAQDGVTTVHVQAGVEVDKLSQNYRKASQALDDIARLTEWSWWIDYSRNLFFEDGTHCPTTQNYGSSDRGYRSCKVERDRAEYANQLTLRAGKDTTTAVQVESFLGDGELQNFELKLEVADTKPVLEIAGTGAGVIDPAKIGVRGVDNEYDDDGSPTAFEWFYKTGERNISQAAHQSPLTSASSLEVSYYGLFEIIVQANNADEIDARKAIEGGSGIHEIVQDDQSIDGRANAVARAQGLLKAVDRVATPIEFATLDLGFKPGQIMNVVLPEHDINGFYLVERVRLRDIGNVQFESSIALSDAGRLASWTDFWRRLEEQGREFVLRDNESLHLLRKRSETVALSDDDTVETGNTLADWEDDVASFFMIGVARIGAAPIRTIEHP